MFETTDAEFTLTLDVPQDVTVVSLKLTEGISKQTHARAELSCVKHLDLDGVLEKDAVLSVAPLGFPARRWTLRVGHIDFLEISEGSLRYMINLYPAMWLLKLTTNTRKFRSMSAQQIVSQILDEHFVEHRFELVRETEVRKYCAQYRESNFDFISRLLEFEGIYYTFDEDGTLVFGDRSPDGDVVDGGRVFDLVEASGAQQWQDVGIYDVYKGRRVATGAATVNDFNWKKPKVKLLTSRAATEDAELEVYDYPVGYRRPDQGERLAQQHLEMHRVPSKYLHGSGNVTSFAPARIFTFGIAANARFGGEYLLVDVEHDYFNRKFERRHQNEGGTDDEVNYRNYWHSIPKDQMFRPPLVTPHPHIAGCHTAMVRGPQGEEIHTDQHGRFRAQFHWDREATGTDEDSRWLRNTQEVATGMGLARVGWEQSIAYVNGDPDRPFGFARDINGQMTPEYGQPSNKTRMTAKTPSYPNNGGFNELRMEDLLGQQFMDWHGERDMANEVARDRSEHIQGNETKSVGASYAWAVGENQDIDIGSDFKVGIGNRMSRNVNGNRDLTVTGSEELKVTQVYAYEIKGNDTEETTGDRTVKAAEKAGSITREVNKHLERTVNQDWKVDGKGNFELIVQDDLTETVGKDKEVKCDDGGIGLRVGGDYDVEVGQLCVRTSKKSMGFTSQTGDVKVDGHATLRGRERFDVNGEEIILEATNRIVFKQAGLSIELTPSKTTIKGAMKMDAGGDITVKGNIDNLTK